RSWERRYSGQRFRREPDPLAVTRAGAPFEPDSTSNARFSHCATRSLARTRIERQAPAVSRFGRALVAAALLHAGLSLVLSRTAPKRDARVASRPTEFEVEWLPEATRAPEPPPNELEPEPDVEPESDARTEPEPAAPVVVQRSPETRPRVERRASEGAQEGAGESGIVALEGAPSGEAVSKGGGAPDGKPSQGIDLGLDGRLLALDAARRGEPSDAPTRRLQQSIE